MDHLAPIQTQENAAQSSVLGSSGFDTDSPGMSFAPQPFQLTAAVDAPVQLTADMHAQMQLTADKVSWMRFGP